MKKVTTFLWFNDQAVEAANFYVSLFKGAQIVETMPGPGGKPMSAKFSVDGQEFICFNGGTHHKLNPAVSLVWISTLEGIVTVSGRFTR